MKKVICDQCGREEDQAISKPRIIEVVVEFGDLENLGSGVNFSIKNDLCLDCRKGLRDYFQPVPSPK